MVMVTVEEEDRLLDPDALHAVAEEFDGWAGGRRDGVQTWVTVQEIDLMGDGVWLF
jgi:hypothetical protein